MTRSDRRTEARTPSSPKSYAIQGLLALILISTALLYWDHTRSQTRAAQQRHFHESFEHIADELQAALAYNTALLRGGSGLLMASEEVTAGEWRRFVAALDLDRNFPSVNGVALVLRVARQELPAFLKRYGNRFTAVTPAGEHDEHFIVTYAEPQGRAAAPPGFDIASDATRREAAERARDLGRPVLSGPLQFATPGGSRPGVLHLMPIYRPGAPTDSVAARRAALIGWVTAGYRLETLFGTLLNDLTEGLRMRLFDGGRMLFDSAPGTVASPVFHHESELSMGERSWRLEVSSLPQYLYQFGTNELLLLALALLFALLLWDAGRRLYRGRERALELARLTDAKLVRSEARYRQLFEGNKAVELLIDPGDGRIIDANAAASRYYGYPPEQLRRLKISDINTLSQEELAAEMARASAESRDHFLFRHRLASGEIRDVEVHSGPVELEEQTLLYSIVHDITDRVAAEGALRASEARYRTIIDSTDEGYWRIEPKSGATIEVNAALLRLLGYEREEMIGRHPTEFAPAEGQRIFREQMAGIHSTEHRSYENVLLRKDGSEAYVLFNSTTIFGADRRPTLVFAFVTDFSERRRAEDDLRLAAAFYEATTEAIMITDAAGNIVAVNPAFTAITGYAEAEVVGRTPKVLQSGYHDTRFYDQLWQTLTKEGRWEGEIWNRRKSGEIFPEWLSIVALTGPEGGVGRYMAIFSDITKRKNDEHKIWRQANYDALTGLPNRTLFLDRLNQALRIARREHYQVALMFVDLDRFKWVNDTLGHSAGDELLKEAARRLGACVRESDTVARLGGDEFTVLLSDVENPGNVERLAEKLLTELARPYNVAGNELFLSGSIGITLYPRDGGNAESLIRNADGAMYRAKEQGRNGYHFFTEQMNEQAERSLHLQNQLRHALQREEFELHYQPVIELGTGRVLGAEALLRWNHPSNGLVMPDSFIDLAEETGLIVAIDQWVLETACAQARAWQKAGLDLFIAVNMSSLECKARDCREMVADILSRTGLPADRLKLEITERMMMDDTERTMEMLRGLRDMGVALAVDDFGTGFSSLSYLKRFPVRFLKIDRSFVNGLPDDPDDRGLVEAMVAMAHSLKLTVIAEGVENEAQLTFLRRLGCAMVQGYHFSRPLPQDLFLSFVSSSGN